ncbi:hypothetical protein C8R45DRAFT_184795 [Mycena sanguinolenta]|nr:hypothetical protein C8R45DRAFT_184795 [Mycena sanguinolenta]
MPTAPALAPRPQPALTPDTEHKKSQIHIQPDYTHDYNTKNSVSYTFKPALSRSSLTQFGDDSSIASSSSFESRAAIESSLSIESCSPILAREHKPERECGARMDVDSVSEEDLLPCTASPFLRSSAPFPSSASLPCAASPFVRSSAPSPAPFFSALPSPKLPASPFLAPSSPSPGPKPVDWDAWIYASVESPSDDEFEFVGESPVSSFSPTTRDFDFSRATDGWKAEEWVEREDTRFVTPPLDYGFFHPFDSDEDCGVMKEELSRRL